jgi:DNA (cytosine-5)-methyltransferase 1
MVWQISSVDLPFEGSMHGGLVSRQPPWVRRISAGGSSSLLPTPNAQGHHSNRGGGEGRTGKIRLTLAGMARFGVWHSVPAGDRPYSQVVAELVPETEPGDLNPEFVEWLMGFPPGWTDCGD